MSSTNKASLKLETFFEVKNAKIYGGEGSVGYGSISVKRNVSDSAFPDDFFEEGFIEKQRKDWAKFCEVPEDCVRVITEDEYHFFTDDEDEEAMFPNCDEDSREDYTEDKI